MKNWDTSDYCPGDFTVEAVVDMVEGCGDSEDEVAVTDQVGNDLHILAVRARNYRVEIVTDQPGREPYVQDDSTADDRPYPKGEATDTRLDRWIRDHVADRRIRRDGIDPVTMTGREIADLLMQVAEAFYNHARIDLDSSVRQVPDSWVRHGRQLPHGF